MPFIEIEDKRGSTFINIDNIVSIRFGSNDNATITLVHSFDSTYTISKPPTGFADMQTFKTYLNAL